MILKRLLTMLVLILSIVAFTACESKGPAEKAGDAIDEAASDVADKSEEAVETVKETLDNQQ